VQFYVIYIAEAHALDSAWPMAGRGHPLVEEPITLEERIALAGSCMKDLGLDRIPTLVDRLDDATSRAYAAWPDRLFLVDRDGRIAYAGGPGPRGFKPEELEAAIRKLLGAPTQGEREKPR
jgi:hypothetical protein